MATGQVIMKFKITDEAKVAVIKHLSENGLLDFCIERNGKNDFDITGKYEGFTVVKLDTVMIRDGDSLTLQGLKMVLNFEET
jgi:hypothetical protein